MSSPKQGQNSELPSVGSITYTIDSNQLCKQDAPQGHERQPKQSQRSRGTSERQLAAATARPRSALLTAVGQANRQPDLKTITTAPARRGHRRGQATKSFFASDQMALTGSSSLWSSSSVPSWESGYTATSETSSYITARIKNCAPHCCHAYTGITGCQPILVPAVATNDSNSAQQGGVLSKPWLPLTGAAVLTILLVVSAMATAAGLSRTALTSEDSQLPGPTPHLVFPVRDVRVAREFTQPLLSTASGKRTTNDRLNTTASSASQATFRTKGGSRSNSEENAGVQGVRSGLGVSEMGPGDRATFEHSEKRDGLASTALIDTPEDIWAQPFRISAEPSCDGVLYTNCPRYRHEFRYSRSANACVEAGEEGGAARFFVCNHGPNRFSSVLSCERSCVVTEEPEDACLDQALLTACSRQDVHRDWWFFDGRSCLAWDFPSGGCPADGDLDVFFTASECVRRCTNPRYPPCRKPVPAPCTADLLKYPAFAEVSPADGRMRCLLTSAAQVRGHRCLAGTNRFGSREACVQVCQIGFRASLNTTSDEV